MTDQESPTSKTGTIQTVTIYAASSAAVAECYTEAAYQLGKLIAQEGWRQVNGGGVTGLMGAATKGAVEAGGIVDAAILDIFTSDNMSSLLRNVEVVDNMPARKAALFQAADAIVALPGGLGTLEELTEVACWEQLGLHQKPVVLLNTNGFWTGFHNWLIGIGRQGFLAADFEQNGLKLCDTPEEVIAALKGYRVRRLDLKDVYGGFQNNVKAAQLAEVTSDWDAARRKFEGLPNKTLEFGRTPLALIVGVSIGMVLGIALTRRS